jgi:predicted Rossmann fold nucleotide-binding protein DprA/Smf involved in DNA uptake
MEVSETMMCLPTPDTQAVLLLCARLGQREENGLKLLSTRQYSALARWLRERSLRPGDLLQTRGREQLSELLLPDVPRDTVERLLDRGAALAIMVERWASQGLWVISRGDPAYPARYKSYLGQAAPPLLYGVGAQELLQSGGLAVVGSRHATDEDLEFARRVAVACAEQHICVISGAAKGVDSGSMMAAMDRGGRSVGVLAEGLGKAAVASQYHEALLEGRLTLISPYEPEARWLVYTAMERNKMIYGLADAALVVSSAAENGGTWAGATEALKHGQVPVYVKSTGAMASGNRKLLEAGARKFPEEPWSDLRSLFEGQTTPAGLFPAQGAAKAPPELPQEETTVAPPQGADEPRQPAPSPEPAAAPVEAPLGVDVYDVYIQALPMMLEVLREPRDERSFAQALGVVPAQAKAWLKRAGAEGKVRKLAKPVRYEAVSDSMPLFPEKSKA